MKASEMLFNAAIRLEREHRVSGSFGWGCCTALNTSYRHDSSGEFGMAEDYLYLLSPGKDINAGHYWFGSPSIEPNTGERVLCLLFAATIAESEGN